MKYTIDSSVIISFLISKEINHKKSKKFILEAKSKKIEIIEPNIVLIEVICAIRRRTGSKTLAKKISKKIKELSMVTFIEIDNYLIDKAIDLGVETGLRGMDAIIVQTAKQYKTRLITLDKEMKDKVADVDIQFL